MAKEIYKSDGKYYRKIKIGIGRFNGLYEWQPMKKILIFYIPDRTKERFWLDDYGFQKVAMNK